MSVFTSIKSSELGELLSRYDIGELINYEGIRTGIENTNYFLTTSKGEFVLTIFEQLDERDLDYFFELMLFLNRRDILAPSPVSDRKGTIVHHLEGKPVAIVERLRGKSIVETTTQHCAQIGKALALFHSAGHEFTDRIENQRGLGWCEDIFTDIQFKLEKPIYELIRNELAYQEFQDYHVLPHGLIHGDLFRDNVLFHRGEISGLLDLYTAYQDKFLYDLAIVANDWCCDESGRLDERKEQTLLEAYDRERSMAPIELKLWPSMLRASALRFLLSRLRDKVHQPTGELVLRKDPNEYLEKLRANIARDGGSY